MFKVASDTAVPGFRVGLPDELPGFSIDENGSVRRPLLVAPGAADFGDPYGNVLQAMAPTAFRPVGMFHRANNGLIPTQYHPYVPVSGETRPSRIRCDKRWTEPMPRFTERRPPKIHCDKRWTEQPTFPPLRPSLPPRL
jgi:hypothetical protein